MNALKVGGSLGDAAPEIPATAQGHTLGEGALKRLDEYQGQPLLAANNARPARHPLHIRFSTQPEPSEKDRGGMRRGWTRRNKLKEMTVAVKSDKAKGRRLRVLRSDRTTSSPRAGIEPGHPTPKF